MILGLASIVVWGGAWLWISWLLPHARGVPWTALAPGALLFGLIVWAMHLLTVFYFAGKVSHASDTYGAIGSAIGILLALYLIGRAMSASAVLNATLWERKQRSAAQRCSRASSTGTGASATSTSRASSRPATSATDLPPPGSLADVPSKWGYR